MRRFLGPIISLLGTSSASDSNSALKAMASPTDSVVHDDAFITQQFQADLYSQESQHEIDTPSKKSKKHKRTRDADQNGDAEGEGKKRRRKKDRKSRDSIAEASIVELAANGLEVEHNPSLNSEPVPSEVLEEDHGLPAAIWDTDIINDISTAELPTETKAQKKARKKAAKLGAAEAEPVRGTPPQSSQADRRAALMATIRRSSFAPTSSIGQVNATNDSSFLSVETPRPEIAGESSQSSDVKPVKEKKARPKISFAYKFPAAWGHTTGDDGKKSYACPVDTCDKIYSRRDTVAGHMNTHHEYLGEILEENGHGGLKVVGMRQPENNGMSQSSISRATESPVAVPIRRPSSTPQAHLPSSSFSILPAKLFSTSMFTAANAVPLQTNGTIVSSSVEAVADELVKRKPGRPKGSKTVNKGVPTTKFAKQPSASAESGARPDTENDGSLLERSSSPNPHHQHPISSRLDSILEDWEIGVGKIQANFALEDDDGEVSENIAFSAPFIQKSKGIKVANTAFEIIRLIGGASHSFEADAKKYRHCPIRGGKVQVNMDMKSFNICQDGLLVIKPGVKCTILNRHFNEAVIYSFTSGEA